MAEFSNSVVQTVADNGNVTFDTTIQKGCGCIYHRPGSGNIVLGSKCASTCSAKYLVDFSGNISVPTGGTVQAISLAIALDGEALNSSVMTVTPGGVTRPGNVSAAIIVDIPKCIGSSVLSIKNISGQDILVNNPNVIITRK